MKILKKIWNAIKAFFLALYNNRKNSHLFWQDYIIQTTILIVLAAIMQKWITMLVVIGLHQTYAFVKAIQQIRELKRKAAKEE